MLSALQAKYGLAGSGLWAGLWVSLGSDPCKGPQVSSVSTSCGRVTSPVVGVIKALGIGAGLCFITPTGSPPVFSQASYARQEGDPGLKSDGAILPAFVKLQG